MFYSGGVTYGGDYLRVCGADAHATQRAQAARGLPPRVRSRPHVQDAYGAKAGITSACAEQTSTSPTR